MTENELERWLTESIKFAVKQRLMYDKEGDDEMGILNLGKIFAFEEVLRYLQTTTVI